MKIVINFTIIGNTYCQFHETVIEDKNALMFVKR